MDAKPPELLEATARRTKRCQRQNLRDHELFIPNRMESQRGKPESMCGC
jgi:hypothetical protein